MSSILSDTTHDPRVAPLIAAAEQREPGEAALRAATLVESDPSPAMLQHTARWLEIRDELGAAGLAPVEVLRVCLRAAAQAYQTRGPGAELLAELLQIPEGAAVARALCEEVLGAGGELGEALRPCLYAALARLAQAGELTPALASAADLTDAPLPLLRVIMGALPLAQREALVLARAAHPGPDSYQAARIVEELLALQDLAATPAVLAARARVLAVVTEEDGRAELEARCAAPIATPPPRTAPTPSALVALDYWLDKLGAEERAARLGPLAEARWSTQRLAVDAPELASPKAWSEAGEDRQRAIAEEVARAAQRLEPSADWRLVELRRFGGPPVAVLARGEARYSLVPGGLVEVGLSERELALIRARAEAQAGSDNHYEQYGSLLDQVELMRPVTRVQVGALLAAQEPGVVHERAEATAALEEGALRLPSEAEWEHLARGGRGGELTYRGDEVPDTEEWYMATGHLDLDGANAFGLWGFGYEPELCADLFAPSHQGLPGDGSPRRGAGPRVVRGGAAQVYPWQACGEWQLLLSAMRGSERSWEYVIALRPVLGVGAAR